MDDDPFETPATIKAMDKIVAKLRAAGWRVQNGAWPATLAAEARWDFCRRPGSNALFPMTPEAARATDDLCSGKLIEHWTVPKRVP